MIMSDQPFTLPLSKSPEQRHSASSEMAPPDWLTPASVSYQDLVDQSLIDQGQIGVHEQFITPFPTTDMEAQQWTTFAKPIMLPVTTVAPAELSAIFSPSFHLDPHLYRPHSSPSTFRPPPDNVPWPIVTGLGIQYSAELTAPSMTVPSDLFEHEPDHYALTPRTPTIQAPTPRKPYQTIAPNPDGLIAVAAAKRQREDEENDSEPGGGKRRKRAVSISATDLHEEDRYLMQLREDEGLMWKEIVVRFATDKGMSFQIPALQMRYKRLKEKFKPWEDADVTALKLAHEFWAKSKWEIITQKMAEYGSTERWSARQCARKWQEIENTGNAGPAASTGSTQAVTSQPSGPGDGPMRFAFVPLP